MSPEPENSLKARREAAYQRGWGIGAATAFLVPVGLAVAAPEFWTEDYPLAGVTLVIGQIWAVAWLSPRVGAWMERRIE